MALLLKKKHIINSLGEEQELNIYTTKTEAVDDGKPCKVIQVEIDGEMITGYIGCTDELDTPKASSKRVMVDGVEYAERKYMGTRGINDYMKTMYPNTYATITEITEDMLPEDTSDVTTFYGFYRNCSKLISPPFLDTRNGTIFQAMYRECSSATSLPNVNTSKGTNFYVMYYHCKLVTEFPQLDTSKGTNFQAMYQLCSSATTFPQIDTSNGTIFQQMYSGCSKATKVSEIDFSKATNNQLAGLTLTNMLSGCSSLRSITFNNLPIGTTEETLRSKCSIPSTVTEIIMNFREE